MLHRAKILLPLRGIRGNSCIEARTPRIHKMGRSDAGKVHRQGRKATAQAMTPPEPIDSIVLRGGFFHVCANSDETGLS